MGPDAKVAVGVMAGRSNPPRYSVAVAIKVAWVAAGAVPVLMMWALKASRSTTAAAQFSVRSVCDLPSCS